MEKDAIDLKYAREVADYIGSEHTEVMITTEDVLSSLNEVIHLLGTYDITTIRASIGMYLVCKAIHEKTDIRVLLTGEISDELLGINIQILRQQQKIFRKSRVKEFRNFTCMMCSGQTAVFPSILWKRECLFGDLDFVRYVMAIDPEKKRNVYGKGKYLLRHAF